MAEDLYLQSRQSPVPLWIVSALDPNPETVRKVPKKLDVHIPKIFETLALPVGLQNAIDVSAGLAVDHLRDSEETRRTIQGPFNPPGCLGNVQNTPNPGLTTWTAGRRTKKR